MCGEPDMEWNVPGRHCRASGTTRLKPLVHFTHPKGVFLSWLLRVATIKPNIKDFLAR